MNKFLIITPVFEDKDSFIKLINEIKTVFPESAYVIAVDDGSVISPVHINDLINSGISGDLIQLRRNVGHQSAIAIGLHYASIYFPESNVVIMDSDGEDMPNSILNLLSELNDSNVNAVVAERSKRFASVQFRTFYHLYKFIFRCFTGVTIRFGNFMALKPVAVHRLVSMDELWIHVAGCLLYSKLKIKGVLIERGGRYFGVSKMNFSALVLHALKAMAIFSNNIVVRICIISSLVAFLTSVLMIIPVVLKLLSLASPGWSSTLFGVLLIIFMQSISIILLSVFFSSVDKHAKFSGYTLEKIILRVEKTG